MRKLVTVELIGNSVSYKYQNQSILINLMIKIKLAAAKYIESYDDIIVMNSLLDIYFDDELKWTRMNMNIKYLIA